MAIPYFRDGIERFRIETEFKLDQTIEVRRHRQAEGRITWTRDKDLGYEFSAEVWLERALEKDQTRAVKRVRTSKNSAVDYKKELLAMVELSQQEFNFVKFYGYFENPSSPNVMFFAMEYFSLGDLHQYINSSEGSLCAEKDVKVITYQILQGLDIMHGMGFAHRDLKPHNIFVVRGSPFWWIKIGDFGITKRVIDNQTAFRTMIGTPSYLAPEVGSDDVEQYTNAVDMWSLGCVSYWALTRATLFPRHNPTLLDRFVRAKTPFPTQELRRSGVTDDAIDFLTQLVVVEPSARMSATMAFEHPWLNVVNSSGTQLERGIPRAKGIPDIRPRDIVIAVVGLSGAGKSTFISHFTSESIGSGDSLVSRTEEVKVSEAQHLGRKFYLVDVPGFDDPFRSDVDTLREIATWLREAHFHRVHFNGIIYLHRIAGIKPKTFRWIFRQLCGEDGLRATVFATTGWDTVSNDEGLARETEILADPTLWGGRAFRQDKGLKSAAKIVDYLISTRSSPVVLDIQREMAEGARSLDQTVVGKLFLRIISGERSHDEKLLKIIKAEMLEAPWLNDIDRQEALKRSIAPWLERIRNKDEEVTRLRANFRELR